jgi:hypothetical protein
MSVAFLLACACARSPAPLMRVQRQPTATGTRLVLVGAPGARINARLAPALERRDGSLLRFSGDSLTPDSIYFTTPPRLDVAGAVSGVIRASVCPEGEKVCRRVELTVQ